MWHLDCLPAPAEGIGINRLTRNFERARVDGAFKGSDREAVEMVGAAHTLSPAVHAGRRMPSCVLMAAVALPA